VAPAIGGTQIVASLGVAIVVLTTWMFFSA